jgi:hypothetical protein
MNAAVTERELDLEQALPGMVLAAPLLDAHGGMLLPSGSALTSATLSALRRRGVERCVVQVAADAVDPAVRAREREQQLARLGQLFRHQAGHPGGAALLQLLTDFRNRD